MTWLIARRGAVESLRDRLTLTVSLIWAIAIPIAVVWLVIRPMTHLRADSPRLGLTIAIYLLIVGLMPTSGSIGIAAGLFAGEKEQGNLLPLLVTPASNRAIFAGKVLAAVLPSLLYAAVGELNYLAEVRLLLGPTMLRLLPLAFSLAMVALVPTNAVLGAALASLVSSRVRTYQSAQMLTSLVLFPIMAALFAFASQMANWGAWALAGGIAGLVALDVTLIVLAAATWRREEVLARR